MCVFEDAAIIRAGGEGRLVLSSHPGASIITKFDDARDYEGWNYILLGIGLA